ncbi:sexual stage antigen s16 [Plasmodium gonderi]|uniref:Sexual stage antigen s16 n=1 Tax=Plasmodium gonderi TaxID=77519 RepID=A0A1Y1JES1_PLAGO|nr:sexual stage antigen s16 [Plasmodium gonderi]GAW79242.1 sexual stage antigen s16 [Plasmodium gonderi]
MNTKKLISSISLIFLLSLILNLVIVQADSNENKQNVGKVPPVPSGPNSDINSSKKDGGEGIPPHDTQSVLQELKNFTNNLEKKALTNRSIIITTAIINTIFLMLLSGLIGYNTKKEFNKNAMMNAKVGKR